MSASLDADIFISMRTVILLLAFWSVTVLKGQLLDSIGLFLQEPPRIVAKLDVRGSFISNQNVRIMGVKLGLEHARRFQYGVGYSFLFKSVEGERYVEDIGLQPVRLRLGYVNAYVDYAFYQRGPWEVRLPVQVGFGSGSVVYDATDGSTATVSKTGLLIYEPAMTVQYRFLKYFGLGAGWGFRLVVRTNDDLGENLSAPIYIIGLRVFFEDLYRDLGSGRE